MTEQAKPDILIAALVQVHVGPQQREFRMYHALVYKHQVDTPEALWNTIIDIMPQLVKRDFGDSPDIIFTTLESGIVTPDYVEDGI